MKKLFFLGVCAFLGLISPAVAVDHDNIDANRPLDFDDAQTIAFREKTLEGGAAASRKGVVGEAAFLNGFARNWQLNVEIDPKFAARNGAKRRLDAGDLSFGVMHNFNRETEGKPALGARFDATLPTGRNSKGLDLRWRAIASRHFGRYGRLHFNADLNFNNSAQIFERKTRLGALLGYSQPLGFPARFNRTVVAQLGIRAGDFRGDGALWNAGIGIRQQISPRAVFDIGLKSDFAGASRSRENLRIVAGYSTAF